MRTQWRRAKAKNVYIYFRHVANEAIKEQKKLYDSAVKTAYYTNIFDTAQGLNCGIDFSLIPQRAVNMVLREPWHGHNYSERVWIHNDRFINAVGQTIEDGIISGHSVSRMADRLVEYVKDTAPGGIRTSAETLVRSETAHFMNQGQKMAYEEIGIKKYQFVAALSELTCDRCGSLDGSVFDTDKAVEGENFPPIHPRCRCVTIMADVNLTSRIARDPLTGENYKVDGGMTFDEWKNSLSDEQKNALKYVANTEKRGIIKNIERPVQIPDGCKYLLKVENNFDNKNVSQEVLKCIDETIKNRLNEKNDFSFSAIKIAKFNGNNNKSVFITDGEYMGMRAINRLYLNKDFFEDKTIEELNKLCVDSYNKGWWMSKNLSDLVNHEVMHAKINTNNSLEKVERLYEKLKDDERVRGFCRFVDMYPDEFMNEAYVVISRGEKLEEKYKLLYDEYVKEFLGGLS